MKRHVIVGGGLSGALLAWRLSHYYRENVTLIECGDVLLEESYRHYSPKDWFDASLQESSIGHIVTIPQENLGNRTMIYSRGSGIGGTSNINAMIWSLGSTAIFRNHWPPFWANNIERCDFESLFLFFSIIFFILLAYLKKLSRFFILLSTKSVINRYSLT